MTITKERIRELALQAEKQGSRMQDLEAAIRLGMAEMREVAAKKAESQGYGPNICLLSAESIRAVRIEGEETEK